MATTASVRPPDTSPATAVVNSLFRKIPIDDRYSSVEFKAYKAVDLLSGSDSIDFRISGASSPGFILLRDMVLELEVRLCKTNGQPLDDALELSICNNISGCLFQTCKVSVGSVQINNSTDFYYYRGEIHTISQYLVIFRDLCQLYPN